MNWSITNANDAWACNCIGPQNGQPRCPCMMRNVFQRNGRWIQAEQDLGPVSPGFDPEMTGAPLRAVSQAKP